MNNPIRLITRGCALLVANALLASSGLAQGTGFTYGGSLSESNALANGTYEFRFELYGQAGGGGAVAGPRTNSPVTVSNGLFTVRLDFGAAPFDGGDRWLEVGVRKFNVGTFSTLNPRQQITPLPYAITASKVTGPLPASGLSGAYTNPVTLNNPANVFMGDGSGLSGISSTTLGGLSAGDFWQRGGNAGTTPGTHFLGTADNKAFELKVNNGRAMRFEPNAGGAPNVIAGAAFNLATNGAVGVTIAGGGATNFFSSARTNLVGSHFGTIGGGSANTIAPGAQSATIDGGEFNTAAAPFAALGGGSGNSIVLDARAAVIGGGEENAIQYNSWRATIGGGWKNSIGTNGGAATIAGGRDNLISQGSPSSTISGGYGNLIRENGSAATIGGGFNNTNGSQYATVPGGRANAALGSYSFAAGRQAKATNSGAFVWADSTGVDFTSTADNQFSVRASGGVRIETGGAGVTVDGQPLGSGGTLSGDGSAIVNLDASALTLGTVPDTRLSANVARLDGNATFTGSLTAIGDVSGQRLSIGSNHSLNGNLTSIAGGQDNTANANWAVIGGGRQNQIHGLSSYSAVVGGDENLVRSNTIAAAIAGGAGNEIGSRADYASIGGGNLNRNFSSFAAIGGGGGNNISAVSPGATVGGGLENRIGTNAWATTIAGGYGNLISADGSFGPNPSYSTIGGGTSNLVQSGAATVAGGSNNIIGYSGLYGTIPGGRDNQLSSEGSVIGGGGGNVFAGLGGEGAIYGVIGGGWRNFLHLAADYSTIAGGSYNVVDLPSAPFGASAHTVIAGGLSNRVNDAYGSIGGGRGNTASAFASIPGGTANVATNYAFAAGNRAKANHQGAFVWADAQAADFPSTATNEVSFRAGGGVRFASGTGGANQTVTWTPGSASWSFTSDRATKERLTPVNPQAVLAKLSRVPVAEWSYIGYEQRHIGPMAQDFHAEFPLNENDKALNDADLHGVALAAIQGLNEKVEQQRSQLQQKETEITELKTRLEILERLMIPKP